jgi:hypothetical protein
MTTYEASDWIICRDIEYSKWVRVINRPNSLLNYEFAIYIIKEPTVTFAWTLQIYDTQMRLAYHSMFPYDTYTFLSVEEAKAKVDLLLNKIDKLKIFI